MIKKFVWGVFVSGQWLCHCDQSFVLIPNVSKNILVNYFDSKFSNILWTVTNKKITKHDTYKFQSKL